MKDASFLGIKIYRNSDCSMKIKSDEAISSLIIYLMYERHSVPSIVFITAGA